MGPRWSDQSGLPQLVGQEYKCATTPERDREEHWRNGELYGNRGYGSSHLDLSLSVHREVFSHAVPKPEDRMQVLHLATVFDLSHFMWTMATVDGRPIRIVHLYIPQDVRDEWADVAASFMEKHFPWGNPTSPPPSADDLQAALGFGTPTAAIHEQLMLRRAMVTEIRGGSLKPTQIAPRMSPQASVAWNTGKSGDDQGSFRTALMMIPRDNVELGTKLCTRLLIKVGHTIQCEYRSAQGPHPDACRSLQAWLNASRKKKTLPELLSQTVDEMVLLYNERVQQRGSGGLGPVQRVRGRVGRPRSTDVTGLDLPGFPKSDTHNTPSRLTKAMMKNPTSELRQRLAVCPGVAVQASVDSAVRVRLDDRGTTRFGRSVKMRSCMYEKCPRKTCTVDNDGNEVVKVKETPWYCAMCGVAACMEPYPLLADTPTENKADYGGVKKDQLIARKDPDGNVVEYLQVANSCFHKLHHDGLCLAVENAGKVLQDRRKTRGVGGRVSSAMAGVARLVTGGVGSAARSRVRPPAT